MATRYVLTSTSPDAVGLLAATATAIAAAGGDLEHVESHRDAEAGVLVQRVTIDVPDGEVGRLSSGIAAVADRFQLCWELSGPSERARVAIAVSKEGACLYDLLGRSAIGELRGDVVLVVSNHADLAPAAARFDVPFLQLPSDLSREDRDAHFTDALHAAGVDLVVLAKYMQIVTPGFCDAWAGKAINIHHSFLPAFVGARPYQQAWERGVKMVGATAHYVTADLDSGPIIAQDTVAVTHRDDPDELRRIGADLERVVLARAVRAHLERRVILYGNRTAVFD